MALAIDTARLADSTRKVPTRAACSSSLPTGGSSSGLRVVDRNFGALGHVEQRAREHLIVIRLRARLDPHVARRATSRQPEHPPTIVADQPRMLGLGRGQQQRPQLAPRAALELLGGQRLDLGDQRSGQQAHAHAALPGLAGQLVGQARRQHQRAIELASQVELASQASTVVVAELGERLGAHARQRQAPNREIMRSRGAARVATIEHHREIPGPLGDPGQSTIDLDVVDRAALVVAIIAGQQALD
ncbi:MAG TPA: hypothetical protein VK034_19530, partial [Enhygromyxa sp.]|nr:hypothetical protein [Enhygromyxa sp.]